MNWRDIQKDGWGTGGVYQDEPLLIQKLDWLLMLLSFPENVHF